ncbi:MAG: DUF2202 domain-containing protein [Bdellovibrionales bacterium]|nr:DUF2202 domain-containing protein [Bdellovibrionales bacterium]
MKNLLMSFSCLLALMLCASDVTAQGGRGGHGKQGRNVQSSQSVGRGPQHGGPGGQNSGAVVSNVGGLNLLKMWEEEKLARDVYLYLLDIWGVKIFSNISSSEQQHMDAVASLLTKYGIPQNVDGSNRGAYSFEEIRQLYVGLTQQGSLSEREAYLVGKGIEELDIDDLKARLNTAQPDAQEVFSRLLDASYRHLSAFNSKL